MPARRPLRWLPISISVSVAIGLSSLLLAGCGSDPVPRAPSASQGIIQNRAVPSISLVNQHDVPMTLASFRGKTMVLAPMLT
ncbi:MAG: hypothetical protein ACRDWB_00040, partial [Acidimicrobiales bacterium]